MNTSPHPSTPDPRHLSHGLEIPAESYSDQPYIVKTGDGAWLCCVTTGPGQEGAEGQHVTTLRSIDGYPVESYSRDDGRTWSTPRYKCYADGRRIKHPRAANFAWRCQNGKYLYWFHNHGGPRIVSYIIDGRFCDGGDARQFG